MWKLFCVLNHKPFRVNFHPFSLSEPINLDTIVDTQTDSLKETG